MGVLSIVDRTRQNHALEHATVAILLDRGARGPLAGLASPTGFHLYGSFSTEEVSAAASEALKRLRDGERELAVSPYCGTNLVVGALLAGVLSGIIMGRAKSRARGLPLAMAAIIGAMGLRRPLGKLLQRHFTTLAHVEGMEIASVGRFGLGRHTIHRVRTVGGAV